jgi:hypothetical protein
MLNVRPQFYKHTVAGSQNSLLKMRLHGLVFVAGKVLINLNADNVAHKQHAFIRCDG